MLDITKLEVLKVDRVNYSMVEGKYSLEYHGKLLLTDDGILNYCLKDGSCIWIIMCPISGTQEEDFSAKNMIELLSNKSPRSTPDSPPNFSKVDQLIQLKSAGFSVAELKELYREGLL